MKKLISVALFLAIVLSLTACGSKTIGTIKGAEYEKKADSIPLDGCGPFCKSIDFKAQYIRTNASSYDGNNDNLLWITSVEELNDYYEQNKDKYYLESVENPSSDQTIGFVDAVKKYDEAFFEKNDLILVVLEESSGSNRHEVTSVDLFASLLNRVAYFIQPNIKRIVPEVGTCDMANWHIIIEIDKEYGMGSAQLKYPNITIEDDFYAAHVINQQNTSISEFLKDVGKSLSALKSAHPEGKFVVSLDGFPDSAAACFGEEGTEYAYFFFGTQGGDAERAMRECEDRLQCAGFVAAVSVLFPDMEADLPFEDFFSLIGVDDYEYFAGEDVITAQGWLRFTYQGMDVMVNTNKASTGGGWKFTGDEIVKRTAPASVVAPGILNTNQSLVEQFLFD